MYTTGTISDFAQRLHQQPATTGDLAQFKTEGDGYLATPFLTVSGVYKSGVMPATSGQWEKEARLQKHRLTGSGLTQQQF